MLLAGGAAGQPPHRGPKDHARGGAHALRPARAPHQDEAGQERRGRRRHPAGPDVRRHAAPGTGLAERHVARPAHPRQRGGQVARAAGVRPRVAHPRRRQVRMKR